MYLHKNLLVSEKERVDLVENNSRNVELSKSLEKGVLQKDLSCSERFRSGWRSATWRSGLKVKIKSFLRCRGLCCYKICSLGFQRDVEEESCD